MFLPLLQATCQAVRCSAFSLCTPELFTFTATHYSSCISLLLCGHHSVCPRFIKLYVPQRVFLCLNVFLPQQRTYLYPSTNSARISIFRDGLQPRQQILLSTVACVLSRYQAVLYNVFFYVLYHFAVMATHFVFAFQAKIFSLHIELMSTAHFPPGSYNFAIIATRFLATVSSCFVRQQHISPLCIKPSSPSRLSIFLSCYTITATHFSPNALRAALRPRQQWYIFLSAVAVCVCLCFATQRYIIFFQYLNSRYCMFILHSNLVLHPMRVACYIFVLSLYALTSVQLFQAVALCYQWQ